MDNRDAIVYNNMKNIGFIEDTVPLGDLIIYTKMNDLPECLSDEMKINKIISFNRNNKSVFVGLSTPTPGRRAPHGI